MGRLDGKVVVLSAAAQGIGRATALVSKFSLVYLPVLKGGCSSLEIISNHGL